MFFLAMMLVGYLAQFINGALGMGYGVFSASLLVSIGFYPAIASASVHTSEIFTLPLSGAAHLKYGNVRRDVILPLVALGIPGGIIGAYFLVSIASQVAKLPVASILLAAGIVVSYRFIFKNSKTSSPHPSQMDRIPMKRLLMLGFLAGLVDAVGGGGWGPIAMSGLILTSKIEHRKVVGSVNIAKFFINVAIAMTFIVSLGSGLFRWDVVYALLIGGFIAAPIAAWICKKLPLRILGILIGLSIVGLNLWTILGVL